jgi:hypothetical protein
MASRPARIDPAKRYGGVAACDVGVDDQPWAEVRSPYVGPTGAKSIKQKINTPSATARYPSVIW